MPGNKKTLHFTYGELASSVRARFLLVDKAIEPSARRSQPSARRSQISNLELLSDLVDIVDFGFTDKILYEKVWFCRIN